jgi:hypothetical protein
MILDLDLVVPELRPDVSRDAPPDSQTCSSCLPRETWTRVSKYIMTIIKWWLLNVSLPIPVIYNPAPVVAFICMSRFQKHMILDSSSFKSCTTFNDKHNSEYSDEHSDRN